jgi:hypothetical protein
MNGVFAEFRRLTELQLHGGSWHGSQLDQLIHHVGPGLRHLGNNVTASELAWQPTRLDQLIHHVATWIMI